MRRAWGILIAITLCLGLLPSTAAAGESRYFSETGQTSCNAFYEFWLAHGRTEILGLPVSPTIVAGGVDFHETPIVVQFYERALLEWHPENAPGERVQLTRLAVKRLDLYVTDYRSRSPTTADVRMTAPRSCAMLTNCETFTATNHTVLGAMRDYWGTHGDLATFGYPLTEQFTVTPVDMNETVTLQFFERVLLEFHPRINGGTIVPARLGADLWDYYKDSVLTNPNRFPIVTVPDSDRNIPYLSGI